MASSYESIIGSTIFKFVFGPNNKEYSIDGAATSSLSKLLDVLLNGNMSEANKKRVEWPDVDEKTFVRFVQWAYTKHYVSEKPDIVLDHHSIGILSSIQENGNPEKTHIGRDKVPEKPLYSLVSSDDFQDSQDSQTELSKHEMHIL